MADLRIVFMGTPDFAVPALRTLHEAGYPIAGVVTAPDKPAGRGQKLRESPVKQFARKHGLRVLQPENLKAPDFQEELKALKPELQVVVAFRKLPEAVWALPTFGTFNLHASLLPDYRGAAPIHWALINGEEVTGVTTFYLSHSIDTGAIIQQQRVPIALDDSAGTLHDKLMHAGANLTKTTVDAIAGGTAQTFAQPSGDPAKTAPKINKSTCRIDWNAPLSDLHNFIRGLSPYPAAWTYFGEHQLKIFWAEPLESRHEYPIGLLMPVGKDQLWVAVKGGYLRLERLQLAGRQRMTAAEFRNGFTIPENLILDCR